MQIAAYAIVVILIGLLFFQKYIEHSTLGIYVGLPYFERQKSGHWMTNFPETKFMAPPTSFSSKAGR